MRNSITRCHLHLISTLRLNISKNQLEQGKVAAVILMKSESSQNVFSNNVFRDRLRAKRLIINEKRLKKRNKEVSEEAASHAHSLK